MNLTLLYWIVIAAMLIGVVGAMIPGLPGTSFILVGILVWSVATNFAGMGWPIVIIFTITILSAGVEYLGAYLGAKRFGASRWAQFGAIIGLVAGVLGLLPALPIGGPILGILVGPVLGAFIGEYLYRRKNLDSGPRFRQALKASLGVVIGSLLGNVIEGLLALTAVVIFVFSTWPPPGM